MVLERLNRMTFSESFLDSVAAKMYASYDGAVIDLERIRGGDCRLDEPA